MPVYEYECQGCKHGFEYLLRTRTEPAPICPKCGSKNTKKQFSVFSTTNSTTTGSSACSTGSCPALSGNRSAGCASGACPLI
ncbi:MAG: zinc ribbon domain-containing protein [Lentisphaerae bacterium]|nr:zinc ribbon domain-containing protein [Lentisphaerota bacterium]